MYYDFNGNMTSTTREELSKITVDPLTLIPHFGMFVPGQDVEGEDALEMYYASYTYNKFNEMVEARTGDATSKYQYNAEGYRTVTEVNGKKTYYVYAGDKVLLEVNDNNIRVRKNIYANDKLVVESTNSPGYNYYFYYYYNGHGDTTILQDVKYGGTVATYDYDVYGNPTEDSDIDFNNNYLFSGYQYDQETGLYYLNSRMYDPEIARFMQQDTYLGQGSDPLSLNLYSYVSNNPIRYYDPTGHILTEWDKANLSASDQQAILDATTDWESGDATQRAEAAAIAAAIRASVYGTTSAVETQASDGYTYIQYKEGDSLLNGWDLEEAVNNPKPYEPKLTTSGLSISSMKGTDVVSYGDVRVGTDIPTFVRQRIETVLVGEEIDEGTGEDIDVGSWGLFNINQILNHFNFTFDPVTHEYVSIEGAGELDIIKNKYYNMTSTNASQMAIAQYTNNVNHRSAEAYNQILNQFNVANNPRYAIRDSNGDGYPDTFCNIFLWDVTLAMGAEIPHWIDRVTGEPYVYDLDLPTYSSNESNSDYAYEMNANSTYNWLINDGVDYGWEEVTQEQAQASANNGFPTVVSWQNPNGANSGHVAMVRPIDTNEEIGATGVYIAQAGGTNFNYGDLTEGLSSNKHDDLKYYTHK